MRKGKNNTELDQQIRVFVSRAWIKDLMLIKLYEFSFLNIKDENDLKTRVTRKSYLNFVKRFFIENGCGKKAEHRIALLKLSIPKLVKQSYEIEVKELYEKYFRTNLSEKGKRGA